MILDFCDFFLSGLDIVTQLVILFWNPWDQVSTIVLFSRIRIKRKMLNAYKMFVQGF